MRSEDIFEHLTTADVLEEEVEGRVHRVGVTNSFQTAVDELEASLDEKTIQESELVDLIASPEKFLELGNRAFRFAAIALALADVVRGSDNQGVASRSRDTSGNNSETPDLSALIPGAVLVLDHVMYGYPRTAGTPEGFLSIGSNQLEVALACYDRAVLFVWRDDCPTCDSMAREIETLLESRETTVPLLSLFGPDAKTTLRERYDVFGAPTTLFVRGGEVESRLLGSRHKEAIDGEINALMGNR